MEVNVGHLRHDIFVLFVSFPTSFMQSRQEFLVNEPNVT